jgi:hypothetical protein
MALRISGGVLEQLEVNWRRVRDGAIPGGASRKKHFFWVGLVGHMPTSRVQFRPCNRACVAVFDGVGIDVGVWLQVDGGWR